MPTIRPVVEDDDPVGVHDRADALGDDDHRRVAESLRERGAQPRVGRKSSAEKLSSKT